MLGNFEYYNPTKLYFGEDSLGYLKEELNNYGPVVMLNYGGGSVKRNGIYDQVVGILCEAGKTIVENPGVMSNPTLEKLREGIQIARENKVDFILSLGGGSVCDYSKADLLPQPARSASGPADSARGLYTDHGRHRL